MITGAHSIIYSKSPDAAGFSAHFKSAVTKVTDTEILIRLEPLR